MLPLHVWEEMVACRWAKGATAAVVVDSEAVSFEGKSRVARRESRRVCSDSPSVSDVELSVPGGVKCVAGCEV